MASTTSKLHLNLETLRVLTDETKIVRGGYDMRVEFVSAPEAAGPPRTQCTGASVVAC